MLKELNALDKINDYCIRTFEDELKIHISSFKDRLKMMEKDEGIFNTIERTHAILTLEILNSLLNIDEKENINMIEYSNKVRKKLENSILRINKFNRINVSPIKEGVEFIIFPKLNELENIYDECKEAITFKYIWKELKFKSSKEFVESEEFSYITKHIIKNRNTNSKIPQALSLVGEDVNLFDSNFEDKPSSPKL